MLSVLGPILLRSLPNTQVSSLCTRLATFNYARRLHIHLPTLKNTVLDPSIEWAKMSKEATKSEQLPAHPYSGRSVRVFNGNLADAFKKLDVVLSRNKVRAQVRQDERHEQKGAKRRRLSRERWRKRFAHEVRLKVQLVQKIRRRGA